ncbi:MAG: ATP-grasp domain-containing protein [Mesorhizobium sp.]|nr:MAG: ATP-grasp domain-containing protein [Mesorhizobium sp.]
MARRAVILIEGASNMPLFVGAARRLGLTPITLSANPARYDYLAVEDFQVIRVNTSDLDALIRECCRIGQTYDIAGITSAMELTYAMVGKLCLHFNLPGPNPASIERCCDKFAQRHLLTQAGVPTPAYRLATDATEIESAAAEIGLPVVVKPAAGTGSMGVRLCRSVDELAEHTTYLLAEKHVWWSSPRILVEEFAQGQHYSVDIMGNDVFGIAAADFGRPPHFVCHEYIYPAVLTDSEYRRIADVSRSCLKALDLGWGPTNIDFRWTDVGPVVIEVNPRLAGTPIPQLGQLAYGVDLAAEHIKLVIGDEWNLCRRHSHSAAARILLPDRDGILDWITGDCQAAIVPGVAEVKLYIEPKTPIVRGGDYRDKIGHVLAASPNPLRTRAILRHAVDLIDWAISPFPTLEGGLPDARP